MNVIRLASICLALTSAGIGACVTSGRFTAETPLGKLEYEFEGTDPHKKMDVSSESSALEGARICLEFKDENGKKTGNVETTIPAECVSIPTGSGEFDGGECGEPGEDGPGRGGTVRPVKTDWFFWGGPIGVPDPTAGTLVYHMTVFGNRLDQAKKTSRAALADARAGFQLRLPPSVEIFDMIATKVVGTDLLMTFADDDRWEDLRLDLNGQPGYRTLDDAVLVSKNGWHLACITIPLADLEYGIIPGMEYVNTYSVALDNAGTKETLVDGAWTVTSE